MKKVMAGMSGGVDSSVSAALLLEQGYDISGVTLNLLGEGAKSAIEDAQKVARKLGIKHEVLDLKKEFYKNIIDYFAGEYINGRTPNPCVVCNEKIKFGALLEHALKSGYDFVATGHYAKIIYDDSLKRWLLKKSDTKKDQSYFLYRLNQHQLSHILFPVGSYEKSYVREIAKKYDLPVASKPESQDICFIKNIGHADFITKYKKYTPSPGKFVDKSGNELGVHKGIINYTVGQRKGMGVALGEPMYVNKIDAVSNSVILSDSKSGYCDEIIAKDPNFILFDSPPKKIRALAKIRYGALPVPCTVISVDDNKLKVIFDNPQRFPAPGQSVVFYTEDGIVIGGGIIEN